MSQQNWIGVDLGGTKILVGIFDDSFQLRGRYKLATKADQGDAVVFENIRAAVEGALQEAKVAPDQVHALGMCVPGQVDPVAQKVKYAPNLGWKDLDVAAKLKPYWTWPCYFENDVKLGTYGEFMHGAAKGAKHVLGIFVGTGVGGGLIVNGELYNGFNFSAGEIGHTIVHWRKGTELETLAGRRAMMTRARDLIADAPKKLKKNWKNADPLEMKSSHLADYYQKDDPIIVPLVEDAAHALGAAVGSAINLLSPEVIVMGGGVVGALGDPFLERIWEIALRYALPHAADRVRFVPAALQDNSGIYGAAAFAKAKVSRCP